MIDFLIFHKLTVFLISIIAICLGSLVYFNNPKGKINKIFVLMVVSMLGWVNFAFFARLIGVDHFNLASPFLRIAWFATPLLFVFLYFLVIYLIEKSKEYRFLNKIILLIGGVTVFFTGFTDLIIKEIEFINGNLTIIYGEAMFPFLGIIFFLICATLYPLIKEYLKISKQKKQKIEYFLVGIFIFYFANIIFNIILPLSGIVHLYWIGDYSTIFLLGFTAYAIVKRELFEIKVILTSLLVALIAILLTVDLFIFTPQLHLQIFKGLALMIFLFFGHMLIKNVSAEIKRREDLEQKTRELKLALGKLKKLDNAKSSFVALTSHQLRTPLTAIKGYISMIIEGDYGRVSKEMVEPLQAVYSSNERLIRLVNDLLDLSKIDTGKMELNKEKVYLESIIISIIDELKFSAEEKGLFLRFEKPNRKLAKVLIDKSRIRQVFLNIIDNAIKYTDEGGVSIRIKKIGDIQQVEIRDTGRGIEKDYLPHLFDSFQRGKSSRKVAGSGLGLHIAKKFIKMHNGEIWAESPIQNTKKGSIFYITFPINQE